MVGRDVATAADEPWQLAGTKFTSVSWSRDGRGFYYSRYPGDGAGGYDDGLQVALYFHLAGTPQAADKLVYHPKLLAVGVGCAGAAWAWRYFRYSLLDFRLRKSGRRDDPVRREQS